MQGPGAAGRPRPTRIREPAQAGRRPSSRPRVTKLAELSAKTHWLHLETAAAAVRAGRATGGKHDLIKHAARHHPLRERRQARLAPDRRADPGRPGLAARRRPGAGRRATRTTPAATSIGRSPPSCSRWSTKLTTYDKTPSRSRTTPGPNPSWSRYNLARADMLEQIVAKVKPDEREQWIRQVADSLSTAAQSSAKRQDRRRPAAQPGGAARQGHAGQQPGRPTSPSARCRPTTPRKLGRARQGLRQGPGGWLERLTKFVRTYPKAEDTAGRHAAARHGERVSPDASRARTDQGVRIVVDDLRRWQ